MKPLSRRDILKSGLLAPAAVAVANGMGPLGAAIQRTDTHPGPHAELHEAMLPLSAAPDSGPSGAGRERLLLDFGWRFHFGNSDDSAKDFGFGGGRSGNFQKTGNFLPAGAIAFDDSDWQSVDLPHDWAIELPFKNDPALSSKGFYPLGRNYPETSIGWYRRVFDLPAGDPDQRISIEFDGSYRETMVVFNGFYIGTHSGGYDPFRFDVTDFANLDGRNVLLVRVDATLSDGWFYEGAGIYRHVWLVKTSPVHVKQYGTFVSSKIGASGDATLGIRTELSNDGKIAQNARVISTILDPSGKQVGRAVAPSASISAMGEQSYQQEIAVSSPSLWSLEAKKSLHAGHRG